MTDEYCVRCGAPLDAEDPQPFCEKCWATIEKEEIDHQHEEEG